MGLFNRFYGWALPQTPRAVKVKPRVPLFPAIEPLCENKRNKEKLKKVKRNPRTPSCSSAPKIPPPPSSPRVVQPALFRPILRPRSPSSPTTGAPAVRPTSVVARKSRTAWLHRLSASSSAILVRSLSPREFSLGSSTRDHQQVASGRRVVHARYWPVRQAVPRLQLVEAGARRLLARAAVGSGFCFSQDRCLLFPVLASLLLTQPLASVHFFSEKPRFTLASDRGSGNFLSLTPWWKTTPLRGGPVRPPRAWPIPLRSRYPRPPDISNPQKR